MTSLARQPAKSWIGKLHALSTLLQNPWCCAALVAFVAVACFLCTGLLWPAAAILSSVLTIFVQGFLEKQNGQQRPHAAHAESLKGQVETCDANALGNAIGESIADRASIVTALAAEIVTCASSSEDFVEIVKQSSVSIGERSVVTSLDHVSISLRRSESEDWGFAWQVGAYGAKRLILVNIGVASPMDSCNASRQVHGEPTIALGDELVCVDTHTEFGAMQETLGAATSLELTFLKAHAVKPVLLSAARRQKKRHSIERTRVALSLLEASMSTQAGQAFTGICQKEECASASAATSNTIMREALLPFDAVVTTKNTFVDFRRAESNHMERFAHSDPTPLSCISPTLSSNDDQSDEATMSAIPSSIFDESDSFSDSYTHFDTTDIHELAKEVSHLQADVPERHDEPAEDTLMINEAEVDQCEVVYYESECSHYDTMDLCDFFEKGNLSIQENRSLSLEVQCVEGVDLQQQTVFPETPHFDTIHLHDFKEEPYLLEGRHFLSEVQFADSSTPYSDPLQAEKNPIHLADLLMEPDQVEISFLPGTRSSSFEQARSLEFHSSHASCYSNNLANDVQQRFLLPSSQCLGTQPRFTPCWGEPANIFSLIRPDTQPNNNSLAYQHKSLLQGHCDENACKIGSFQDASVPSFETKTNRKIQQKQKSTRTVIPQVGEDWYCPKCFDLQFRANLKCRMCGLPREHGVTQLEQLNADRFLQGHNVTAYVAARFRSLAPDLQQTVMSGGSLHGARDPTAVLSNRIRRAQALACAAPSCESAPIKLGFDRKQKTSLRHVPVGSGGPSH